MSTVFKIKILQKTELRRTAIFMSVCLRVRKRTNNFLLFYLVKRDSPSVHEFSKGFKVNFLDDKIQGG